jgi:hypothetical protein
MFSLKNPLIAQKIINIGSIEQLFSLGVYGEFCDMLYEYYGEECSEVQIHKKSKEDNCFFLTIIKSSPSLMFGNSKQLLFASFVSIYNKYIYLFNSSFNDIQAFEDIINISRILCLTNNTEPNYIVVPAYDQIEENQLLKANYNFATLDIVTELQTCNSNIFDNLLITKI